MRKGGEGGGRERREGGIERGRRGREGREGRREEGGEEGERGR